jgi:hypothetical protein
VARRATGSRGRTEGRIVRVDLAHPEAPAPAVACDGAEQLDTSTPMAAGEPTPMRVCPKGVRPVHRKPNRVPRTRVFVHIERQVGHSKSDCRQIALNAVPRTLKVVPKTCSFVHKRLKLGQNEALAVQIEREAVPKAVQAVQMTCFVVQKTV